MMSEKVIMSFSRERYIKVMDLIYFVDKRIELAIAILEPLEKEGLLNSIPNDKLYSQISYAKEVLQGTHDINL